MHKQMDAGCYDQGLFNITCKLADEINQKNHLHFLTEIDVARLDDIRDECKIIGRQPPTYTAFVFKAAGMALRSHPHLNCMIQERPFSKRMIQLPDVTGTIAVERMVNGVDMVLAPFIQHVDQLSLSEITLKMKRFAQADPESIDSFKEFIQLTKWAKYFPTVIGATLSLPKLSSGIWRKYRGGSFVVTSPGKYGGCDQVLPPWPWPLTFSFGNVKVRPFVVDGRVEARKTMRLTITADRRLAHGAALARFAEYVRELLEHPTKLMGMQSKRKEKIMVTHSPQSHKEKIKVV